MLCDPGSVLWPQLSFNPGDVMRVGPKFCETGVLWCDLGQEEREPNAVNRVERFDCHPDHVM